MTGEAWNISNVYDEPDFFPEMEIAGSPSDVVGDDFKDMVVVPVLDGQGRAIAVIRAMNKISDRTILGANQKNNSKNGGGGFTVQDVQVLKSLASHISVNLQSVFQDEDDEELRLRDTIRILKEHRRKAELQKRRRQQQPMTLTDTEEDDSEGDEPTHPAMRARSQTTGSAAKSRESLFPE